MLHLHTQFEGIQQSLRAAEPTDTGLCVVTPIERLLITCASRTVSSLLRDLLTRLSAPAGLSLLLLLLGQELQSVDFVRDGVFGGVG